VAAAVRFHRTGGPDVLVVDDVPPPEPGPGQVRLAVVAAGVNPVECRIRRGEVPVAGPGPWGLGTDVAGVVDAVGPVGSRHVACSLGAGGAAFAVGDAVFGRALGGAYAEYALADVADLLPKPAALPWDVAASVAISGETAYRTLGLLGVTGLGGTLLVHGASGGVGALAVQLAVLGGARVIGTAGPSSLGRVRALGAEPVAYGPGWAERVRALAPEGVDAVLDTAGAGVLGESVALAGGPEGVVTIADRRRAAEHGVTYSRGLVARVPMAEVFAELLPALVDGRVAVHVAHRLPLAEAAQTHRISEAGHPGGRIVLTVRATPRCT
jgi:NADPH:quinone reductase-like Zn-dependent oxidoreductase